MLGEILLGASLLLIPVIILLIVEYTVARKRRSARELASRSKSRSMERPGLRQNVDLD